MEQTVAIKFVKRTVAVVANSHLRSAVATNVKLDLLDETSVRTLVTVTARLLVLETSAVSVVNEYLIEEVGEISRVGVVLRILAQRSDFPSQSFSSPAELFASVTTLLTTSITSGSFDTTIAAAAIEFQAAELLQAVHDNSATVSPPTYIEVDTSDSKKKGLSVGVIVGVAVGEFVAFILIAVVVFLLVKKQRNLKHVRVYTTDAN